MRDPIWTSPSPASALHHGVELRTVQSSTSTCLPQSLISEIPSCAVTCITSFTSLNYPGATCANTSDLTYLCTQPNSSGLTIGEGSVQCIVSSCIGQDKADVEAYNICNGIANARPNTAKTITATIIGTSTPIPTSTSPSTTMTFFPATIGTPTSLQDVSTIVMATDSPTWIIGGPSATATAAATTTKGSSSNTRASSIPGTTSGATAVADDTAYRGSLKTPQIVGIAVGGAATVLIVSGLFLLFLWLRRRRRERRRSQRRSRIVEQTPPPNYQSPPKKAEPIFDNSGSFLAAPSPNGRFYGSQPTMEDKRRSFWRKSIKPEEIGVAVSPKMPADSPPVSASSEQSFSLLLPAVPAAALRPAPLDLEAKGKRGRCARRRANNAIEFEDESPIRRGGPERILVDNQPFVLEKPPMAKRPQGPPPSLRLPAVPENLPRDASRSRIPLTPTYDNGNIQFASPAQSVHSPENSQISLPMAGRIPPPSASQADSTVVRSNPPATFPPRALGASLPEPLLQPRNPPRPPPAALGAAPATISKKGGVEMQRQSTVSSLYTEIDEDVTPEEVIEQLELQASPPTPSIIPIHAKPTPLGRDSPIKDLRYPAIPRSAAVSRHAEKPAQLRASFNLSSPPTQLFPAAQSARPRRSELVRAGVSFVQTDTTSSDGYMSDSTIEFPAPPITRTRSSSLALLKNHPSSGNRGPVAGRTVALADGGADSESKMVTVAIPQRSPSSKARITPSKSKSGDLYLTVEI